MQDVDEVVESLPPAGYTALTRAKQSNLSKPFLRLEVEKSIKGMGRFKAPGPDGFQPVFYQDCWTTVGDSVSSFVLKFFETSTLPCGTNDALVVLIPKVVLKEVMPKLIGPAQSSFIPGRLSADNIFVVQEAVHSVRRKQGRKGWMLLKLDFEKAYDRIRWDFLEDTVHAAGFSSTWIEWILQSVDHSVKKGRGPSMFALQGENYHLIGSLKPKNGDKAKFQQLYIVDTENEVENRMNVMSKGNDSVQDVGKKKFGKEVVEILLKLIMISTLTWKHSDLPGIEVAALSPGDFHEDMDKRDIVLQKQSGKLKRIHECHVAYLALQYPLLFSSGEDGFRLGIKKTPTKTSKGEDDKGISIRQWFAHRLHERKNEKHTLFRSKRLFQQFLVDGYTMIESNRLRFIKKNQKKLQSTNIQKVKEASVNGITDLSNEGKKFVIPPSFTGGPRYMQQMYLDAMATCKHFRFPDLFITFTCNAKWPEITRFCNKRKLRAYDRPDIICRIFKMKLDNLMDDLTVKNIFGKTVSEIPDRDKEPKLYEVVKDCMIHGQCGHINPNSPCMVNGRCSKYYPKAYAETTKVDKEGFPVYRRRKSSIKYLFKYVHKGLDRVSVTVEPHIAQYVSACEAFWRSNKYLIHYRSTAVQKLSFHEKGKQPVYYREGETAEGVLSRKYFRRRARPGFAIGRINYVPHNMEDEYHLRVLINSKRGPTGFDDIKTVKGVIHKSYRDACFALGLLDDDKEYIQGLKEANFWCSAKFVCRLFVIMLLYDSLATPDVVWEHSWPILSEDILRKRRNATNRPDLNLSDDEIIKFTLQEIHRLLKRNGTSLKRFKTLPQLDEDDLPQFNQLLLDERKYNKDDLRE
ncbi:PREDICTED: uncharacterized protein LOC109130853 [Camelina sativa]|uniref:Uncharacterized protein LOC109130853 n=1 Tax=Camelina sativa TaxID=90675 RepID=A0ABM1RBT2_CAMSA|nr:PREDICTED: uncharacterized protein LOC109130853 [Camelina sativa]